MITAEEARIISNKNKEAKMVGKNKMEVNIYGVHGNNENIGICLSWSDEKIGFGQLVIEQSRDDKSITIDSECMDKPFIKEVFIALVDNAILIG